MIRAAEQVGVQIPRFCDHPLLDAGRRLPPVPGRHPRRRQRPRRSPSRRPPARSPVAEGMVVNTQATSEVADKAQQGIMEFLLINHPLDCPVCDKGGECPLQNQAMSNGRGESRFARAAASSAPSPSRSTSPPRCCSTASAACCAPAAPASPSRSPATRSSRCIERGALQQVGIYEKEPFESYFSGNTIQICPVGALTSAEYRFRSRPFDLVSTPVDRRARRLRLRDPRRPPARQGDAPPRRQRPRGQRGVDHRQGPLRVRLRSTPTTGSPTRRSATRTASCGPPRGPRRSPSPRAASAAAGATSAC